jgi:hypothetical protein
MTNSRPPPRTPLAATSATPSARAGHFKGAPGLAAGAVRQEVARAAQPRALAPMHNQSLNVINFTFHCSAGRAQTPPPPAAVPRSPPWRRHQPAGRQRAESGFRIRLAKAPTSQ